MFTLQPALLSVIWFPDRIDAHNENVWESQEMVEVAIKICLNVKSTKGGKQKGSITRPDPTTATKGKIIRKNVYSVNGYAQDCDVFLMLVVSLLCVGQGTFSYLCSADFLQKIFEFIVSLLSTLLLFFVTV